MSQIDMQKAVATALANCRFMRNGSPAISNVLDLLPAGMHRDVMADAAYVLAAIETTKLDAIPKGGSDEGAYSLPALATDKMLDAGWPRGEVIDASFDRQGAYADLVASAMPPISADAGGE